MIAAARRLLLDLSFTAAALPFLVVLSFAAGECSRSFASPGKVNDAIEGGAEWGNGPTFHFANRSIHQAHSTLLDDRVGVVKHQGG